MEHLCDSPLSLLRFSLSSPRHALGFRFSLLLASFPCTLLLTLTRHTHSPSPLTTCASLNLASTPFTLGVEVNDLTNYEATVMLKQPCYLEARTVHELSLVDHTQSGCCPKTRLTKGTVLTDKGSVEVSIHSRCVWGLTGIIIV